MEDSKTERSDDETNHEHIALSTDDISPYQSYPHFLNLNTLEPLPEDSSTKYPEFSVVDCLFFLILRQKISIE